MPRLLALVITLLALCCPSPAAAHPHLFITTRYVLTFDAQGLAGIHVFWAFDDMYSAMILEDFDSNKDGQLNQNEIDELAGLAAKSLPQYNFFTNIDIEGTTVQVPAVRDLRVTHIGGLLFYDFFVPCVVPAGTQGRTVKISPYDPEYFAAMFFAEKQPVILENAEGFAVRSAIGKDRRKAIWYNTVHPEALTLTVQKKP